MTWWRRLVGGSSDRDESPRGPNYLAEAIDLEKRGDFANALTSYRLALRARPDDPQVLQNIAIAFSRTGQPEEALRHYKRALEIDPSLSGAHYGLAFLLLKRGDAAGGAAHLEAFLRTSPASEDAAQFVLHARRTLQGLRAADNTADDIAAPDGHGAAAPLGDDASHWEPDRASTPRPSSGHPGPAEPGPGR